MFDGIQKKLQDDSFINVSGERDEETGISIDEAPYGDDDMV